MLLTYEVECRPTCDIVLVKTQQDYYKWRNDYYNTTYLVPGQIKYGNNYTNQIQYRTPSDVILVVCIYLFNF